MSFLARSARVAARRSVPRSRFFATDVENVVPRKEWLLQAEALEHHAAGLSIFAFYSRPILILFNPETSHLWRKISWYVCIPAIITCTAWVYNAEAEHNAHLDHLRAEHDGHLPEAPAYDYLNRRVKPYPWGVNSLFFNPHAQKNLEDSA